jgi:surface protein
VYKLPVEGGWWSASVDWGDGTALGVVQTAPAVPVGSQIFPSHTYAAAGTYEISITPKSGSYVSKSVSFGGFRCGGATPAQLLSSSYITDITQWGSFRFLGAPYTMLTIVNAHFFSCSGLTTISATDAPIFMPSSSMYQSFYGCKNLTSITNINSWDVSNCYTFNNTFAACSNFNSPLSNWNMHSASQLNYMFASASQFDQPIGSWNLSSLKNATGFMNGATSYSTANLDNLLCNWQSSTTTWRTGIPIDFGPAKPSCATGMPCLTSSFINNGWTVTIGAPCI